MFLERQGFKAETINLFSLSHIIPRTLFSLSQWLWDGGGYKFPLSPFPHTFLVLGMAPSQARQLLPSALNPRAPRQPAETKALLPSASFRLWGFFKEFSGYMAAGNSAFSPNTPSSPLEHGSIGGCHHVPKISCFVPSVHPPASFKHQVWGFADFCLQGDKGWH